MNAIICGTGAKVLWLAPSAQNMPVPNDQQAPQHRPVPRRAEGISRARSEVDGPIDEDSQLRIEDLDAAIAVLEEKAEVVIIPRLKLSS